MASAARSAGAALGFLKAVYLTADPRWLGVFRVVLGGMLFVDVARRWADARMFYTNDGILPNHFAIFRPMGRDVFSLFFAVSTYGEATVAFALSLFCVSMFLIGYKTKLFHVLSALIITSLNARNIFVENGGTVVVNLITVWTLFLPLGTRFSMDAMSKSMRHFPEQDARDLNDRSTPPRVVTPVVSLVVLGLILQWVIIYWFNAVTKDGVGWKNGTALHWFWHQDRIVTWASIVARENAPLWFVKALTYGTLVIEFSLPFLIAFPFFRTWTRRVAFALAISLHGGIAAFSRLGPFSYVMCSFFILLLGERDFALVTRWFGRQKRRRLVVYDQDCGICFWTCRVLKRLDPFDRLEFFGNDDLSALPAGVEATGADTSVLAIDPETRRVHREERAVYEVARALPFGILAVFWMRVPGLSLVARGMYRAVARNRFAISAWFGLGVCGTRAPAPSSAPEPAPADRISERDSSPPGDPLVPGQSPLRRELGAFAYVLKEGAAAVLLVTLATQATLENRGLGRLIKVSQPEWMRKIVDVPRLYQGWRMFAPEPPYDDGRVVVDARTVDGRKIDPFTHAEPDFDPYTPTGWGHEQFMCDYHNRIRFPGHAGNRPHLKDYLLRYHEWTGNPSDRIVAFDAWWVSDKSPPPGQLRGEPMPPAKLVSHGHVRDSGATAWLAPGPRAPGSGPPEATP